MQIDRREDTKTLLEKLSFFLLNGIHSRLEPIMNKHPTLIRQCKPVSFKPVLYDIALIQDQECCLATLRKLAELGVDFGFPNKWGLIMELAKEGRDSCVIELIEKHGILPTVQDEKGNSLLHVAALTNSVPLLEYLLGKGLYPEIVNEKEWTPVDVAIRYGNVAAIKCLAEASAHNPSYMEQMEKNLIEKYPVLLPSALQDIHQHVVPGVQYEYEVRESVAGKGGKGTFSKSGTKYARTEFDNYLKNGESDAHMKRKLLLLSLISSIEYSRYGHLVYTTEDDNGECLRSLRLQLQNIPKNDVTLQTCMKVLEKAMSLIRSGLSHLPNAEEVSQEFGRVIDRQMKLIMGTSGSRSDQRP